MFCELCQHDCHEEEIEVVKIYNEHYNEEELFWACPDCVNEYEEKEKK